MKTPAIHQAIRLSKYPVEMEWLCFPDSEYPEGITDLLRLCSSKRQRQEFSSKNHTDEESLYSVLIHFIEKAILIDDNSDEKKLGLDKFSSVEQRKLHYQLLMKIYHPDINPSSTAGNYSAMISNAYNSMKMPQIIEPVEESAAIISESRTPPQSFFHATQRAESQISNAKSAIAILATVTVLTLVATVGHFYDPANPELVVQNPAASPTPLINKDIAIFVDNDSNIKKQADSNQFQKTKLISVVTNTVISDITLQSLLSNLELAYETGDIATIKPILANTPEIREQTDQQINQKLETLFNITSERKMLLYDFNWRDISGKLQGKGKFLSRYHLQGEEQWLTREGTALVTATKTYNQLKIINLKLENEAIEH